MIRHRRTEHAASVHKQRDFSLGGNIFQTGIAFITLTYIRLNIYTEKILIISNVSFSSHIGFLGLKHFFS